VELLDDARLEPDLERAGVDRVEHRAVAGDLRLSDRFSGVVLSSTSSTTRACGAVTSSIALADSTLWIRAIWISVLSASGCCSLNARSLPWLWSIARSATVTGAGTSPIFGVEAVSRKSLQTVMGTAGLEPATSRV
jgi:hypothetical protein